MADEITLTFTLTGDEAANRSTWRARAPEALGDAGYQLTDESYDTLVYEANVTTTAIKILMLGLAKTLYRLSVTFRPDGEGNTSVTITGQAPENVRTDLARLASA
jgi:hypothetical protein